MKKICRKRLNNKGFTLVELLAVVIILAVVMGIAMNSVLSSMNKARGGSLADTAMVIANSFNQKYTESLVDGVPSNVYGDVLNAKGYNFQSSIIYYIDARLADTFNISTNGYVLKQATNATSFPTAITSAKNTGIKESFVFGNNKNEDEENVKINVLIVYDKELLKENYKLETNEEIRKYFSAKIKEINTDLPKYKAIKGFTLTEEPLIRTTTNKIKRTDNLEIVKKINKES